MKTETTFNIMFFCLIFAFVSTASFLLYSWYQTAYYYNPLLHITHRVETAIAESHMSLHHLLDNGEYADIEEVWQHFGQGADLAAIILNGGESESEEVKPLRDLSLRKTVVLLMTEIIRLQDYSRLIYEQQGHLSEKMTRQQIESIFSSINDATDAMTAELHDYYLYFNNITRRTIFIMLAVQLFVALAFARISSINKKQKKEYLLSLESMNSKLKAILDTAGEAIIQLDTAGKIVYANPAAESILGYRQDYLIGKNHHGLFHFEDFEGSALPETDCPILKTCSTGFPSSSASEIFVCSNSRRIFVAYKCLPLRQNGKQSGAVLTYMDITPQVEANAELSRLLDERTALVQELYHRTKNNMQLISSILALKAEKLEESQGNEILSDIDSKVQAIALVHDMLYSAKDLSGLNLKDYLSTLADLLVHVPQREKKDIELKIEMEDMEVRLEKAMPLGLLLCEWFSNSLKHAFTETNRGRITIQLSENTEGESVLVYSDDGRGMAEGTQKTGGIGLLIIRGLAVDQLRGSINIESVNGLTYTVRWKNTAETSSRNPSLRMPVIP